jgi:DUF177 domain-containing protein
MRYKIKDIPSEGLLVQLDLPRALFADALEGVDADLAATTGNVRVELTKDREDNVFARGDVKALVTLPCASCLGPALVKINAPLKMTYVAEGEEPAESEDPLEDVDVATHDGVELDLTPIIREQIILGLPMSAHCREDCAGLCTVCGQNKNERDCGHKPPALEDPRFAALKNLKLE